MPWKGVPASEQRQKFLEDYRPYCSPVSSPAGPPN